MKNCRGVGFLAVCLLIAGCGGWALRDADKAIEGEIAPGLRVQAEQIQPGQTDRATVRSLLGEPWIESELWGVDVYRTQATVFVPVLLVFIYYPVPLPDWESASGYLLVAYDDTGLVESLGDGILFDPKRVDLQDTLAGTRPAGRIELFKTEISAGDFSLGIERDVVKLQVATERLASVLKRTGEADHCKVAALAISRPLRHEVSLDGAKIKSINYQVIRNLTAVVDLHDYPEAYVATVTPGQHALTVAETERFASARTDFRCDAGEEFFATFETVPTTDEAVWAREMVNLSVGTRWPESVASRRLLLFMDDDWLMEH